MLTNAGGNEIFITRHRRARRNSFGTMAIIYRHRRCNGDFDYIWLKAELK